MTKFAWTSFVALSALSLAACSQKTEQKADNAMDAAKNAVSNAADATGNAASNAVNATGNAIDNAGEALKTTPTGQEFADKAAKSDAFEIAAAKLAEDNAASSKVKAFAKMMITAHTESTAKVKKAAAAASPAITPDPMLTEDQTKMLSDLRSLKGADFDKKYVDGQIDAHKDALSLMQKYAKDGTVPSLKTAAGEIAPVVEKHLASAKALKE